MDFRTGNTFDKHLRHASGKTHTGVLGKLNAFRESRGTVLNPLHGDMFVQRNTEHLKVVLDIVMLCAKQDIALRGHRERWRLP